jgi:hypothetical protein
MVSAFEGNMAETKTVLPVIREFMTVHQLPGVTVVADAGMISEANQKTIEAAGLSFILGAGIPNVPYIVVRWRRHSAAVSRPTARGASGHFEEQRIAWRKNMAFDSGGCVEVAVIGRSVLVRDPMNQNGPERKITRK